MSVLNTELLIRESKFDGSSNASTSSTWTFGQILPLFLTALPAYNTLSAFYKKGVETPQFMLPR